MSIYVVKKEDVASDFLPYFTNVNNNDFHLLNKYLTSDAFLQIEQKIKEK